MAKYVTAPIPSTRMPPGIPYIVGNEAAERFSFYGMRAILTIFMTQHLLGFDGQLAPMGEEEAKTYYHLFVTSAYFFPFFGAILADAWLGKYRTIINLSLVYCLGHLALALDETRLGLFAGLILISVGSGGIKSCVSAHVGDQFGATNQYLLERVFGWFYFAINLGATASMILTPWLLHRYNSRVAFGVPGVLMFLATLVFWMGRHKFVHIPAGGLGFFREAFSSEGLRAMGKLSLLYVFIAMFWCIFDQTGSAWVLQALKMDRHVLGKEILPSQIQAVNSILILIMIPSFGYLVYPAINRVYRLTPLRKIAIGLFLTFFASCVPVWIETRIVAGYPPHIVWQLAGYVILTAGEVMVSITALEFSYTQAPKKMKSLLMGLFFLGVSAGNGFTSAVNWLNQLPDGTTRLSAVGYYIFFAVAMLATADVFVGVASGYRERTYIQDEATSGE